MAKATYATANAAIRHTSGNHPARANAIVKPETANPTSRNEAFCATSFRRHETMLSVNRIPTCSARSSKTMIPPCCPAFIQRFRSTKIVDISGSEAIATSELNATTGMLTNLLTNGTLVVASRTHIIAAPRHKTSTVSEK